MTEKSFIIYLSLKESQKALREIIKTRFQPYKDLRISREKRDRYIVKSGDWSLCFEVSCVYCDVNLIYIETPEKDTFWFYNNNFCTWDEGFVLMKNHFFWFGSVASFMRKMGKIARKLENEKYEESKRQDDELMERKNAPGLEKLMSLSSPTK